MPHDFNFNEDAAIEEEKKQGAETFSFMGRLLAFMLGLIAFLLLLLVGLSITYWINNLWWAMRH